ncbi:uncharacterized protein BX663DRAFT_435756 [Cokeromyces recurvatus]|uniref:uncharacterized protein n=1 Tax=Cokeromyces recurvatus TaxID=90255 RepID=UPI00221FE1EC|nr:uncharacterized protein BX663DRAFT_435756 [Cokeromyces recurvatus]KAI7902477.1 hypothetical protein BX663DRAFT_435756 [Cokeromyces recurvatus]
MGYVTRINRIDPLFLPEELDNINIKLLPILKTVYQARLTMEQTNKHVRKCVPERALIGIQNPNISITNKLSRHFILRILYNVFLSFKAIRASTNRSNHVKVKTALLPKG